MKPTRRRAWLRPGARRLGRLAGAARFLIRLLTGRSRTLRDREPGLTPERSPRSFRPAAGAFHALVCAGLDLVGGLELLQWLLRPVVNSSPLTSEERATIAAVLGPAAIDYDAVRLAQGGLLNLIFRLNGGRHSGGRRSGGRAFTLGHTIYLPLTGAQTRANRPLLVHEAAHVLQYERVGLRYIGEALWAQWRLGRAAYDYGGPAGLRRAEAAGQGLTAFNREQQAQIAGDYCRRRLRQEPVLEYNAFIEALRAGRV